VAIVESVTVPPARAAAPLDEAGVAEAVRALAAIDLDLAGIADRHGPPPLWGREPGFETLVRIILEQQISLAAAEAAYQRLVRATGAVEPGAIAAAGEGALRSAGQTRQKSRYLVGLARDVLDGRLDLEAVAAADDDDARARLTSVVGIGRWSADIYLLMALRRPDIWPTGDLALAGAMRRAKRLDAPPTGPEQAVITEAWRPWRAVAARLLWHAYLAGER
jgi:DNA-3-methyladenine glycosylase II